MPAASMNRMDYRSTGPEVVSLQRALATLGKNVKLTGVYDVDTEDAVRDFQGDAQLDVTGVVDGKFLAALGEAVSRASAADAAAGTPGPAVVPAPGATNVRPALRIVTGVQDEPEEVEQGAAVFVSSPVAAPAPVGVAGLDAAIPAPAAGDVLLTAKYESLDNQGWSEVLLQAAVPAQIMENKGSTARVRVRDSSGKATLAAARAGAAMLARHPSVAAAVPVVPKSSGTTSGYTTPSGEFVGPPRPEGDMPPTPTVGVLDSSGGWKGFLFIGLLAAGAYAFWNSNKHKGPPVMDGLPELPAPHDIDSEDEGSAEEEPDEDDSGDGGE